MQKLTIFEEAVKAWGVDFQVGMMIEECGELIVALQHFRRKRASVNEVKEELADVEIMLYQMKIIFGNYDEIKQKKVQRLEDRLWRNQP